MLPRSVVVLVVALSYCSYSCSGDVTTNAEVLAGVEAEGEEGFGNFVCNQITRPPPFPINNDRSFRMPRWGPAAPGGAAEREEVIGIYLPENTT